MPHVQRRIGRAATALAVTALTVSACAPPMSPPAGVNTARVTIEGRDTSSYPILCTQRSWLWTIETLPEAPGFTAMVQTGGPITPKVIRIRDLQGFTGSSTDETMKDAEAGIDGSTFTFTGTVGGSYAERPTKPAAIQYRIQAHC